MKTRITITIEGERNNKEKYYDTIEVTVEEYEEILDALEKEDKIDLLCKLDI